MYTISKSFHLSFGHRVHSQQLDPELSNNQPCVCRHLHGHNGNVTVSLQATTLNPQSMVTDFAHLNWFKKWIDDVLDHKFIIDMDDPLLTMKLLPEYIVKGLKDCKLETSSLNYNLILPSLMDLRNFGVEHVIGGSIVGWHRLKIGDYVLWRAPLATSDFLTGIDERIDKSVVRTVGEFIEGLVLVNFVPTSENLSQFLYHLVKSKLGDIVYSVVFSETASTNATYTN